MKRLELQIERCRRETENEEFSDTTGISTEEFIDFFNDAQEDLQSAIARQHQSVFIEETTKDVAYGVAEVDLPKDILLDNRVAAVYYTTTGNIRDNRRLKPSVTAERVYGAFSDPILYIRRSGKLILYPTPDRTIQDGLTIAYVKKLPRLDIRRATIKAVTTTGNQITSLQLDDAAELYRDELLKHPYFCVVNAIGEQTMRRVRFTDIDNSTSIVTIDPSFEFEDGETIAVGDYLVTGEDTYNVSMLPDTCERFLTAYCNWKVLKRDSSNDSSEQTTELEAMRNEIVDIFSDTDEDTKDIPIVDTQFIDDELWEY